MEPTATDEPTTTAAAPRLQVKSEYWTALLWLAALLAPAEAALADRMSASR